MPPIKAATLVAPHRLEVREYPWPAELEPGAVLLRMLASGICGTDKHTYRGETEQYVGTEYERSTPFPIIQGHENVGVVAAIGDGGAIAFDGTPLEPGDRVVPAPNRACGRCRNCLRGFPYYLCRRIENYGNSLSSAEPPHLFGGWAEYLYLRPGTAVFRVPDSLPDDIAVLTEIFAVTHSLERAARLQSPNGFRPGAGVAVIGAGALGTAHAIKASLMGAGRVIVVDRSEGRRGLAARLADAVAVAADDDAVGAVRALCDGDGADVVVNATGFPGTFATATAIVRDARDDRRGRRVRRHGRRGVQSRLRVRAQPRDPGRRGRGPARLPGHARAPRPPPAGDPVRRHGLAPLRRRAGAGRDGGRTGRRRLGQGPHRSRGPPA